MTKGIGDVYGLHSFFLRSVRAYADRPALEVGARQLNYADLYAEASGIAAGLQGALAAQPAAVGVFAHRSVPVYIGILGTLMSGCALVPLNPGFPVQRTMQMVEQAGISAIVVDAASEPLLASLIAELSRKMVFVMPDREDISAFAAQWPQHVFLGRQQLVIPEGWKPVSVSPDSLACVFFTSGSTGIPKGVGVLHRNVIRFVEMSLERYREIGLGPEDRFSQFYDITFDSSMFDLYVSWAFGACLCCPTTIDWVNPNKYIVSKGLTVIDIVPSTGHNMDRGTGWRPGRFENLRLCRFGGEALSAGLAAKLAAAAPNAIVENVYGPTECTVDAAYYRWDSAKSAGECEHGIVPIGYAGNQVDLLVVHDDLTEVELGDAGELLIAGPQVTPGYWRNPERTEAAFIRLPKREGVFYRTGDLVRRPEAGKPIVYLGRMDQQIKISGVRIELGEIEQAMRDAANAELSVAVGWPITDSGAAGVVGFLVASADTDVAALREVLKQRLPGVMVPREIHCLEAFPINVNGKIDRKALLASLEDAGK